MSRIDNEGVITVAKEETNEVEPVKTRANGRATREKILKAAREIIIEKGTDSLSIDRVIKQAGVSKGSFLYHFPHRQALVEALVNEYAEHLAHVQTTILSTKKGDCAMLEAYAEWYDRFSKGKLDSGSSPLVALAMASRDNRRFMEPVREWYRQYFDQVKKEACGPDKALVYTLTFDAMFFHHLFGTDVLTDEEKAQIIDSLKAFVSVNETKTEGY